MFPIFIVTTDVLYNTSKHINMQSHQGLLLKKQWEKYIKMSQGIVQSHPSKEGL